MQTTPVRFLTILALAFAAIGFGAIGWAFIAALGPNANRTGDAADPRIIDLATIAPGQTRIIIVHGQTILIRHLSAGDITARAIHLNPVNPAFVVFNGVAPGHFCLLNPTPAGFTDPCDGTRFDPLGAAAHAPARRPDHLTIPPHRFLSKSSLQLG